MEHDLDPQSFFERVTAAACRDLFGVRPHGSAGPPTATSRSAHTSLCSVIGFTGRDVQGHVGLALTEQLSGSSNPIAGADPIGSATAR